MTPHSLHRMLQLIGLAALIALSVVVFTPVTGGVSGFLTKPARLEPADAIVVLGAGAQNGLLSDTSLRRLIRGIQLYRQGLAPTLVLTGPRTTSAPAEAELRAVLARQLGVPATAIVTETSARTTREEAQRVATVLRGKGITHILLVVDAPVLRRASGVFARAGFDVLPAPATGEATPSGPERRLERARELLMELCALAYYRIAGYL
jgi:uncharacterized SAM-binding protein YcdF (DUF218 family)